MPGAADLTAAMVLGGVRYGDTSRIVRLATREQGMVSAIAKGVMRPRSRFGAALQLLSEGQAHLLVSRTSELHLLTAFDVTETHAALARDLPRFAAASALAEVAARFIPPTPNPGMFDDLRTDVALIERAPLGMVTEVALRAIWHLIADLGLGPTVTQCARDGRALPDGSIGFSLRDGGFVCNVCAVSGVTTRLGPADRADLVALLEPGNDLPVLDAKQSAAHRRLLLRWIREHLTDGPLPALDAWAAA